MAQAIAEQKAKIYAQLDGVRNDIQSKISGGASNVTNVINGVADGANNAVNSLVPDWLKSILDKIGLGDAIRNAQNSLRGAINDARNWLNGQVNSVRDQINGAVGQFIEMVKNAYVTGGEINQAIENAANWLKGETDRFANFLNDKIGEFKGQILGKLEWTRNIRTPDWARGWPINAPDWNLYDHAIVGLVNGLASGASNAVNGASNFFKDTVSVVKPLAQGAVAVIVDAIFGDKTGNLYNEIYGINQQIANIRNGVEQTIKHQTARFKADLDKMLGDLGREGKRIFDTLMDFSNSPTVQIGMAVLEVILGLIPGVGQAIDVKDTAFSLYDILIQGKRGVGDFIGLIGSLAGWVPGIGDAIKSVAKVAMKGTDFLVPILKNLGPDVTETVIKTISELDWGKLLVDVVDDIIRRWDDVAQVLNRTAGWIIDGLNVRPAMELAGAAMFNLKGSTDNIASSLNHAKKPLLDPLENAANKSVRRIVGSLFPNKKSQFLASELKLAQDLQVAPLALRSRVLDDLIDDAQPLKWAIDESGKLLFIPREVFDGSNPVEISHAVLTRGNPVQAAGGAEIVRLRDNEYQLLRIDRISGHFEPSEASLDLALKIFEESGISIKQADIFRGV